MMACWNAWRRLGVPRESAGVLGPSSLETLRWHASGFVLSTWRDQASGRFIDCGAGAGVLGVLLALELPTSRWTLVEANERRCELARRAVTAAGLEERVRIEHTVVEDLAHHPEWRERVDGVAARLFGPAAELAECGLPLLRTGGTLVVSVSAATRRQWESKVLLPATGCDTGATWSTPYGDYLAVHRVASGPPRLPRRRAARRRSPLLPAGTLNVSRETRNA